MESFRQAVKGWLGIAMLALLAVPLVLVGMESYFSGGRTVAAAEVDGVEISQTQLDRAYQAQLQQVQARLGNARLSDEERVELRRQVLENLVQRQLLLQSGERAGYLVSDQQVLRLIRETPAFQENGRFSAQRYASVLSQIGESPASFPQRARQEVITAQRMSGWLQSAFVTRQEAERLLALDGQTRDVRYVEFPLAAYLDRVAIDDEAIAKAYAREARLFQQPEQVRVDYLQLSREAFADQVRVDEAAVEARYQQRLQALAENQERRAAHILITANGDQTPAQARATAEALRERLLAGEPFAELARAHSQDPGSAAAGGDLGFASRGTFEPAFEQALFALAQPGDISPVVETPFGLHLIQLQAVREAPRPTLASLRDELVREVRAAEAEELYIAAIEQIDAAAYESANLQAVAETAGAEVRRSGWFSRQGGEGLFADARVIDTAFSDELVREKRNSTAVSLPDGSTVWLQVAEHQPARKRPLAEVRDLIQAKLASERALQLARTDAEALLATGRLETGARPVRQQQGLSRREAAMEPALLSALFRSAQPRDGQPVASLAVLPDRVLVSQVTAVYPGEVAGDDVREIVSGALSENRGQQELQGLLAFLREQAKVKVFDQPAGQD